jgi:hypothetical protein
MIRLRVIALAAPLLISVGCQSVDPTEQFFNISLVNDTSQAVVLRQCDDTGCTKLGDAATVQPGSALIRSISDRGYTTRWAVLSVKGRRIGCLPLRFTVRYDVLKVPVSRSVPCPGNPIRVTGEGRGGAL